MTTFTKVFQHPERRLSSFLQLLAGRAGILLPAPDFFAALRSAPAAAGHVILIPPRGRRICSSSRRALKLATSATADSVKIGLTA